MPPVRKRQVGGGRDAQIWPIRNRPIAADKGKVGIDLRAPR